MIKKLTATFALFPLLVSVGSAANIAFNNIDLAAGPAAAPITLADMTTAVPDGTGFVALGTFTLVDGQINLGNIANVITDFRQFGSNVTFGGAGGFNIPGLFGGDASQPIAPGDIFVTPSPKNIYLFAGNGASLAASTEYLVYKFAETFGVDNPVFAATADLTGEKPAFSGLLIGGQVAAVNVPGIGNASGLHLAAIPEPSVALLGVFGVALLVGRRRK